MKTKRSLPPGPKSWLPLGMFRELRRGPLEYLTKLAQEYGEVASFRAVGQRYVIVSSPELAREILMAPADEYWKGPALQNSKGILGEGLLTAEGEEHRWQRKLMTGAFHAKHVENYAGEVIGNTREMLDRWGKGGEMEIRGEMMGLTLVIAGKALFGTMLEDEIATVHRCMDDLMNNYVRSVVPWGKLLNMLPLPSTRKLARARADMQGLVERMIAARRRGNEPVIGRMGESAKKDLLSTLIAATDGEEAAGGGCPHAAAARGARLTDVQLRDQCITILTAGHETTANAMTFTLYLLAKHPEEQRLLREEIVRVVGDGKPTVAMMEQLVRTRWVLSESMRLFPPAWTLGRQNRRVVEVGGYRLPAKCTILMPQWIMHRDAKYWEEPLAFRPERWREPKHPRFAYLPFSTGPRNCIGESFAWLEMVLALAMVVREFEFSMVAGAEEMKVLPAITLRPRSEVMLTVRKVQ